MTVTLGDRNAPPDPLEEKGQLRQEKRGLGARLFGKRRIPKTLEITQCLAKGFRNFYVQGFPAGLTGDLKRVENLFAAWYADLA